MPAVKPSYLQKIIPFCSCCFLLLKAELGCISPSVCFADSFLIRESWGNIRKKIAEADFASGGQIINKPLGVVWVCLIKNKTSKNNTAGRETRPLQEENSFFVM